MRKIIMTLALTAAAFITSGAEAGAHDWGYFYLYQEQLVESGEPIDWQQAGSIEKDDDDIFIDPSNSNNIVLEEPGLYHVRYILTVAQEQFLTVIDDGDVQFALYLNDGERPLPGSIYAVGNAISESNPYNIFDSALESQIVGNVIISVTRPYSKLQLRNQFEVGALLTNEAGTDDVETWGNNVSASILILKLANNNGSKCN